MIVTHVAIGLLGPGGLYTLFRRQLVPYFDGIV